MIDPVHSPGIPFVKASACGNDFLIVEGAGVSDDLATLTRRLCDRHNGVGADGVEWLFPDEQADISARLFNADGSEAEVSGNGTRCVAAYLCSKGKKKVVAIHTGAGLKTCRLLSQESTSFEFESDMGQPVVADELALQADGVTVHGRRVSMGNPHFVIFGDEFPLHWQQRAAALAAQSVFPHCTNVEFVVPRGPSTIEIRLYERGVGETSSSGTGSCASAVAAIAAGRVSFPVTVIAPGGSQTVRWQAGDNVYLTGPVTVICRGEFFV
jgi:diaminopimelate epimerase